MQREDKTVPFVIHITATGGQTLPWALTLTGCHAERESVLRQMILQFALRAQDVITGSTLPETTQSDWRDF